LALALCLIDCYIINYLSPAVASIAG